jgi:mannose-6-phosphate isomerase class I
MIGDSHMYCNRSNYDKYPVIEIFGYDQHVTEGYESIINEVRRRIASSNKIVVTLDFYPGVNEKEILNEFKKLDPVMLISAEDCMVDRITYGDMIRDNLTNDRVFGRICTKLLKDFFVDKRLEQSREQIAEVKNGIVLVYGFGAGLISEGDILIYCDLARWEIQNRFKKGMPNYHTDNEDAPFLEKYKQGFFVEWRLADRHKKELFHKMDYLMDTNLVNSPKIVTGAAFLSAIREVASRPFRLVPYFDPGVWGGQWMKEVCDLPKEAINYAWSFDGVPEENSLYLRFGQVRLEIPAIDLVFLQPKELLGERVYGKFGDEFPIRFDFLDTMGGQNLSLQVHPLTEYIQNTFGMHYTQDESYYILDCDEEDSYVYLGIKEGINPEEMLHDLKIAETGKQSFDAEKYVNKIPVKKHDHVLIPAGTVHCSGSNTMVLEISSTPYIFTFKLWDWGRLGLDGMPRPIHLEHGAQAIQWDRTTTWVENNLIGQASLLYEEDGVSEERTGLHELEFIETKRHRFSKPVLHDTGGSVNVLNLVQGEEAEVFSPIGAFEPFVVHYAETFIIPASVGEYGIKPTDNSKDQELMTIKASVR